MVESRKIRLVIKDHYCAREKALTSWSSFDSVSRVNDVGDAVLVAGYGASTANDDALDSLDTADMILEAYIQPPGHDSELSSPAWAGFLRDRKIEQDGPVKVGTYTFRDYNHLLARRVIEPPVGASHDEDYDTTANVMRNLVRRHAGEDVENPDRQFPGLFVESNDEAEDLGLYGGDVSALVFGANAPDWVRVNVLYEWNGNLYLGTETQPASGAYAAIYRSSDGTTWELVMDGTPGIYAEGITGIHCFAEFDGALWAGCSQDFQEDDAVILRTVDGDDWTWAANLDNHSGVWALCEFGGEFFAGTTGYTSQSSETYLWKSVDGFNWTAVLDADASQGCPCYTAFAPPQIDHLVVCEALYEFDSRLYIGIQWKRTWCLCGTQYGNEHCRSNLTMNARIYRTDDGAAFNLVHTIDSTQSVISFTDFGGQLYAGTGRSRWTVQFCNIGAVEYGRGGQIWRSSDGLVWEQTFGSNLDSGNSSGAISGFTETLDQDANTVLWAASGRESSGNARVYQSADGETWINVVRLTTIPYAYCLDVARFGGSDYAATGCYAKTGSWQADHGDVWRVVPSVENIEDAGVTGRWVTLLSKLQELAEQSGQHDFGITGYDSTLYCSEEVQNFLFQVRNPQWGTDNRWDDDANTGVTFQIERDDMGIVAYVESRATRPTALYVLGSSSGEERVVKEFQNYVALAESPWNRVEGTVDAQSVDSDQSIDSIGLSELSIQGPVTDLSFEVQETDTSHYKAGNNDPDHPAAWDLGDYVTAYFSGVQATCKVKEVSIHATGRSPVYTVDAEMEVVEVVTEPAIHSAFAATQTNGLYFCGSFRFSSGDPTWELVGQELAIDEFAVDRANPADFQACRSGDSIYARRPTVYGDENWQEVFTKAEAEALVGTSLESLSWVEINAAKPGHLYTTAVDTYYLALKTMYLFRSEDYGATWTAISAVVHRHYQRGAVWAGYEGTVYPDGDVLYLFAVTGVGGNVRIYYSIDEGDTFALKDTLSASSFRTRAMVDPTRQEVSYAGYNLNGADLSKSTVVQSAYSVIQAAAGINMTSDYGTGWVSEVNGNIVRSTRVGSLWWSNNAGVDWDKTAAPYADCVIWGDDTDEDHMAGGRIDNGTVGLPHIIKATDDKGVHWWDKGGANASDVNTDDSIPYDCGGLAENGLFLWIG